MKALKMTGLTFLMILSLVIEDETHTFRRHLWPDRLQFDDHNPITSRLLHEFFPSHNQVY
jgi:hypothetical protein